jgi:hydroxymethylpyrimidine/phosphomethylpyrimidine kinase
MPPIVLTFAASDPTGGAGLQAALVTRQAARVLAESRAAAFKVGVLASAENARAVAAIAAAHAQVPLVLDPVLASGRGDPLASEAVREALLEALVPRASVVTPNTLEAERLGGVQRLLALGCRYVLLTGAHEAGAEVTNRLYDAGGLVREDRWQRLPGSYHGSGCTLASALAAHLAKGLAMPAAAHAAQEFTWRSLASAFASGAGQLTPNRFA